PYRAKDSLINPENFALFKGWANSGGLATMLLASKMDFPSALISEREVIAWSASNDVSAMNFSLARSKSTKGTPLQKSLMSLSEASRRNVFVNSQKFCCLSCSSSRNTCQWLCQGSSV